MRYRFIVRSQIVIFKRIGVEPDRTTLANWMIKMGVLVQPLINRLSEIANEQSILHMDDLGTPLRGKRRFKCLTNRAKPHKVKAICGC